MASEEESTQAAKAALQAGDFARGLALLLACLLLRGRRCRVLRDGRRG